ncbi:peptidase S24 [Nocardioides mangrovicus]|uniref:Peptidase S24 n=1 Tax=Nocardioides mangrovicus TaxID=2478913 RepID=A0A3L8P7F2_9ACTN|nr:peptidase S24 [Nocardioides mangrovicus]
MHGRSMRPTLVEGDLLLVRHGARPVVGDVVVVRFPDGTVAVKRAVLHDAAGWWVERDNPREGTDSSHVGSIPDADVLAVALARVWPRPRPLRRRLVGRSEP